MAKIFNYGQATCCITYKKMKNLLIKTLNCTMMIPLKFDRDKLESKVEKDFEKKVQKYLDINQELECYFEVVIRGSLYKFSITYFPEYNRIYDDKDIHCYKDNGKGVPDDEVKLILKRNNYNPNVKSLYFKIQIIIQNQIKNNYKSEKDAQDIDDTNERLRYN